ncbi:MAG: membrane protein insertion efficiency factor YidD [Holosporaceae bacterium]|nr:membrane protein insertion efficiency factor YidD [Holosporaceae bacterium]
MQIMISLIRIYQKILSPHLRSRCRFYPSCSEYAVSAIRKYGPVKGLLKAAFRLLRCNPFSKGGTDFP